MLFGQQRPVITGQIAYGNYKTSPFLVINVSAEKKTYTDSLGNFTIIAKTGDLFAVSGPNIHPKKIRFTPDLLKNGVFTIAVQIQATQLDEVIINKTNISVESLGIVPKGQKTYTPMERRLETAGDFKPIHLLGLLAGSLEIDPILNAINGKTKRLKKEIEIEAKLAIIEKIKEMYTPQEIQDKFNIPELYTEGYLYYISEDEPFAVAVNNNKVVTSEFIMARLATEYLDILKNEK